MLSPQLTAPLSPRTAELPGAELAMLQARTTRQPAQLPAGSDNRRLCPTSRRGSPEYEQRSHLQHCSAPPHPLASQSPHECERFAQPRDAMNRRRLSLRRLQYCGSCGVEFYNEVRPHSAHGGLTPASIRLPSCSPASSPLRAGVAGGLRPGLTQAVRDGRDEGGRDGETTLDRTEKHRHDGRGGNPGLYF